MDGITSRRGRRRRNSQQMRRRRVRRQIFARRVTHADLDPFMPASSRWTRASAARGRGAVAAVAVGRPVGIAR